MAAFFGANEIWKSYEGDGREPVVLAGVRETDVKVPVSGSLSFWQACAKQM